jgi:succinoglycan biosynthesis transport protein ExoP
MAFYFQVLWKRKILIVMTTLATLAVVVVGLSRMQTVYTARTVLRVIPFGIEKPDYGTYLYFDQLSNTFIAILENDTVKDEAKTRLSLADLPSWKASKIPNTELLEIAVTDKNPQLAQDVSNTLADLLVEQVQSQYLAGVDGIEATLGTRIQALDDEITKLVDQQTALENQVPRDNAQIATFERAIAAREDTRSRLLGSYNQALVAQTAQANTISIINRAALPDEPSGLSHALLLAVAAVVGVAGGVVLAFVMQNLQPHLYTSRQLEEAVGFPIIGELPPIKRGLRRDVFAGTYAGAEVLRRLRARLLQTGAADAPKILLVTSPNRNQDSATVAANIAISLTTVYPRVLIVDTNLRQPYLHVLWKLSDTCGLGQVLGGGAAVEDALQTGPRPNLDVMVAGAPDLSAVDEIASAQFAELLDDLSHQYGVIVLHGAPLVSYADSIVLSERASDILLVVTKDSADKPVSAAGQELAYAASKVVGIVTVP